MLSPSTCDAREPKFPSRAKIRLLQWFDSNRRTLPWRESRDPYRIWISEVMLQQTTVAAVISRYLRFLAEFPDVRALANASEQEVLKSWEGLGYYNRARNLHRAAQILVANEPTLPDNPELWAELPGVGRYILGAVLSQAFDRRMPIVEANTMRLLCRLFGQANDPKSTPVKHWLWRTAEQILPHTRVGDFNQALMELGALVCTPATPTCPKCPLKTTCVANREGLQKSIPLQRPRPSRVEVREVCLVVRHRERYLLMRRPATGRWANMWEFPRTEMTAAETQPAAASRLLHSLGIDAIIGDEIASIPYSVTHHRIRMVCFEVRALVAKFRATCYEEGRWLRPDELPNYPVSSPQRKLAAYLK
ncbi:MAG: A/G-specific adenine glycosylase [Gemmataceae bacterium]|nr:A/G-specific adenine glycosylase [Gemmataceae bacterium]